MPTITVEAGSSDRLDTPMSVRLPESLLAFRPLLLVEVTSGQRSPVPAQVEQGKPGRLWWILNGKTKSGSKRVFELSYGPPSVGESVDLLLGERTLDASFGGQQLFSYNHAHVLPPKGADPAYIRSGYIHPMFSPSGKLITEDFPGDHLHHKGIWFPWTKTEFEGRKIDFWNLGGKTGTVQFAGFDAIEGGSFYGRFRVKHEFVDLTQPDGGKVALNETWDVRVYAVGGPKGGWWLWDLTSTQRCASESPLHLKKYRYGGLGFRGPKEWKGENYTILTSEGKTSEDGHATRARWCAHSGAVESEVSTVVLMSHTHNIIFPEPMRIWNRSMSGCFFNFAPIQARDITLKPGKTTIFRYRFLVHQGAIDAVRSEHAWKDFCEPPTAKISA